jgi:uncharacterized cofD-like protein
VKNSKLLSNRKIVTIGGGTGSSTILRGLKKYTDQITAIVTVADDGGGSGILREDMKIIPPGNIRSCLVSLANMEPAMQKIMSYRFSEGILKNQSFGNLFLAAMSDIYGGFDLGLKEASKVLAITGQVLPMTLDNVVLFAELEDGSVIEGESNITFLTRKNGGKIQRVFLEPELPKPLDESIQAILEADIVLIGPGSLYTSIMPNLLVPEIRQALTDTPGKVVYICNIMTQPGETDGYDCFDHLEAIIHHCEENPLDAVMINDVRIPRDIELKYYYTQGSTPVLPTKEAVAKIVELGIQVVTGNYLQVKDELIRHDAERICKELERF